MFSICFDMNLIIIVVILKKKPYLQSENIIEKIKEFSIFRTTINNKMKEFFLENIGVWKGKTIFVHIFSQL